MEKFGGLKIVGADEPTDRIKAVWNQTTVPVAFRTSEKGTKIRVRLPFHHGNRQWLRNERRTEPEWMPNRRFWEIPKAWFNDFVERSLEAYGAVYIIQPYREREVCAPACRNATGHECQCSCMGAHHGSGSDDSWFDVSETFSVRWGEAHYACRKLTASASQQV